MSRRLSVRVFVGLQLTIVGVFVAWALTRRSGLATERSLPPLREEPLRVAPLRDDPSVVSDGDLRRVLGRLTLRYVGDQTVIGHVDHVLRLWGPRAVFEQEGMMSGADLFALLTDHQRFARVYGSETPPLLIDVPGGGVRVRALEGPRSTSHVDHLLATLAELGTPLSQPIRTPAGETTYRAVLEQSLEDFSLNQAEYEWSALAYALFLPPVDRWFTSEGQEVTFGRLAERVMRERLPSGVCSAHHRLHALVVMLRVDDLMAEAGESRILDAAEREGVLRFVGEVTRLLVAHQHADGFWNFSWPFTRPTSAEASSEDGDRLGDRIIATGHALEWWSLAPEELLPPRDTVVRAAGWIVRTVDSLSDGEIQENISFMSHAGRALAQWRARQPNEVVQPAADS
jgi:hypothetical protein